MGSVQDRSSPHGRRDLLLSLQQSAQAKWADLKVFEVDAPQPGEEVTEGKFFGTFPYPYMNGLLHLGHAFSLSKLEFVSAYHRLCGKRVLFPQGFHCTGMPIKACADKLNRELELYGCPPQFPEEAPEEAAPDAVDQTQPAKKAKSKVAAKKGPGSTQWAILLSSGIPAEQIAPFRTTDHWLQYFPAKAVRDLKAMGCGIDWRRSFITTDVNPFYDSFVRWQLTLLRIQGKVVKDKRLAVYSPKDGQPCADHDRASGEGVGPQEYTLIKMQALELPGPLAQLEGKGPVYFLAATLRPETMYGQTNCWALPEGVYGAYRGLNNEVYVMTQRSALNMSYQELMSATGTPECLLRVKGQDLIGVPLQSPNSLVYERIYVLPLLSILTNKGTGIVTSVPSDSPDDYRALQDLVEKPKFREKFGVRDEWVLPYKVVPIIDIPGLGSQAAVKVCTEMGIGSQNDVKKLAEAKQLVYLKGFTDGVLLVGPYKGRKVSEVKGVVKGELVARGQALLYSEPERLVMSRSGEECVVALTDQWYLTYGSPDWLATTQQALANMSTYSEEAKHGFEHALSWLQQWACSRSYGLGSKVPWDEQYLIESLSDSTIYMAYYTVAQFLQHSSLFNASNEAHLSADTSLPQVDAADMTPEVWDHIFLGKDAPQNSSIPASLLQRMRSEFEFWYPMDIRVSGKDLIQNHLSFSLYNHTAVWDDPAKWPRSFRCNGHLLLNAEKMSKSTGNFMTLQGAVHKYSADAMRLALADAGDGMDDANFEESTANAAILRLTKELAWVEEVLQSQEALRDEATDYFIDRAFENEMNIAADTTRRAYDELMFREVLKAGWYDLQKARDTYRFACAEQGMKRGLVMRFIELQARLVAPIVPHWSEHLWGLLGRAGTVLTAGWPRAAAPDLILQQRSAYLETQILAFRKVIQKLTAPKKKASAAPGPQVTQGHIMVAESYVGWQETVLRALSHNYATNSSSFSNDVYAEALAAAKQDASLAEMNDKSLKQLVMPFAKFKIEEAKSLGALGSQALQTKMPFSEAETLQENVEYLMRSLNLQSIDISTAVKPGSDSSSQTTGPAPGQPVLKLQ